MKRRQCLMTLTGTLGMMGLLRGSESQQKPRPNVIVIYTDDHGAFDVGAYGAQDIQTPNIDSLAAGGIRFTQFYAPAPVCSPSRAGLLTGKYPVAAGVPGNCSSDPGVPGMPASEITLAELFRQANYTTAHIGKWHLGFTPETMPNAQGFDYSFGHMGGCIDNYSHFFYWHGPNRHDLYRNGQEIHFDGQYFPDLMVREAAQLIRSHREKPFLLYFAMNAPHYPYQGDAKWLAFYNEKKIPYPRNLYAAFVSSLDERIGQLLKVLKDTGLEEQTIVVFQSDQGHSVEERAHFGGGSAGELRGAKFSLFEGGIRVPAILCWPGHIAAGESRDQVGHGCDWFPTLAALCGIETAQYPLDGRSLVDVIQSSSSPSPHRELHWYVNDSQNEQWAVRQGDWKLIGNPRDPNMMELPGADSQRFLVNLKEDPSEKTNLFPTNESKARDLEALHSSWLQTVRSIK